MKIAQKIFFLVLFAAPMIYGASQEQMVPTLVNADVLFKPQISDVASVIIPVLNLEVYEGLRVRSIEITGNDKTHDDVILRQISLKPGSLIVASELKDSARRVEALWCFERGGVFWRIHNAVGEFANLELVVIEAKGLMFRSDIKESTDLTVAGHRVLHRASIGVVFDGKAKYSNIFGRAWNLEFVAKDGSCFVEAKQGRLNTKYTIDLFDWCGLKFDAPNIFDSNVGAGFEAYYRPGIYHSWSSWISNPEYQPSKHVSLLIDSPLFAPRFLKGEAKETVVGCSMRANLSLPNIDRDLKLQSEVGLDHSNFEHILFPRLDNQDDQRNLEATVHKGLQPGTSGSVSAALIRDTRNHLEYPTRGGYVRVAGKLGLPRLEVSSCYMKLEALGFYFFPLRSREDLVLVVGARAGTLRDISGGSSIRPRDLTWEALDGGWRMGLLQDFRDSVVGALEVQKKLSIFASHGLQARMFCETGYGWDSAPRQPLGYWEDSQFQHVVGIGCRTTKGLLIDVDVACKFAQDRTRSEQWLFGFVKVSANIPW